MVTIKTEHLALNGTDVHLIGVAHGRKGGFIMHPIGGPTPEEVAAVRKYLGANGFNPAKSIILLEGHKERDRLFWSNMLEQKFTRDNSFIAENGQTKRVHNYHKRAESNKGPAFGGKAFSSSLAWTAAPVVRPITFVTDSALSLIPRLRRGINEIYWEMPVSTEIGQKMQNSVRFRDFVQASVVVAAAKLFPKNKVFLFQGLAHTNGTAKFLKNPVLFRKYRARIRRLAPRANKIAKAVLSSRVGALLQKRRRQNR